MTIVASIGRVRRWQLLSFATKPSNLTSLDFGTGTIGTGGTDGVLPLDNLDMTAILPHQIMRV